MKHIKLLAATGIIFLFIFSYVNAQTTETKKPATTTPATKDIPKKPSVPEKPASQPLKKASEAANTPVNNARITFNYSSFDFGVVPPNSQATHHFPVKNIGTDTLFITQIKAG